MQNFPSIKLETKIAKMGDEDISALHNIIDPAIIFRVCVIHPLAY